MVTYYDDKPPLIERMSVANWVQVATAFALALAGLKTLAVAGSVRNAVFLIQATGPWEPLIHVGYVAAQGTVTGLCGAAIVVGFVRFRESAWTLVGSLAFLGIVVATLDAFTASLALLSPFVFGIMGFFFWLGRWFSERKEKRERKESGEEELTDDEKKRKNAEDDKNRLEKAKRLAVGSAALYLVLLTLLPGFWLPYETIVTGDGARLGAVIQDDDRWLTILSYPDGNLRILEESDVSSRQVCETTLGTWPEVLVDDGPLVIPSGCSGYFDPFYWFRGVGR